MRRENPGRIAYGICQLKKADAVTQCRRSKAPTGKKPTKAPTTLSSWAWHRKHSNLGTVGTWACRWLLKTRKPFPFIPIISSPCQTFFYIFAPFLLRKRDGWYLLGRYYRKYNQYAENISVICTFSYLPGSESVPESFFNLTLK